LVARLFRKTVSIAARRLQGTRAALCPATPASSAGAWARFERRAGRRFTGAFPCQILWRNAPENFTCYAVESSTGGASSPRFGSPGTATAREGRHSLAARSMSCFPTRSTSARFGTAKKATPASTSRLWTVSCGSGFSASCAIKRRASAGWRRIARLGSVDRDVVEPYSRLLWPYRSGARTVAAVAAQHAKVLVRRRGRARRP
jgi:hypothetical protein